MKPIITIEQLDKSYGSTKVLTDLNLTVVEGEVFGLLGRNGSGKTTLLNLLLGLLRPDRGRIRIIGRAPDQLNGRIGYLPERLRYHTQFTPLEYLTFLGRLSDMAVEDIQKRSERLIHLVGLSTLADVRIGTLSKGNLQRLGIAQALLSDPDVLLFDEPTSGLDLSGQAELIELLTDLRGSGHTILLTTHYLREVEQLCDRVGVLAHGRIAAIAEMESLRGTSTSVVVRAQQIEPALALRIAALGPEVRVVQNNVTIQPYQRDLQDQVVRLLMDGGAALIGLDQIGTPLERFVAEAAATPPPSTQPLTRPPLLTRPPAPVPERAPLTTLSPNGTTRPQRLNRERPLTTLRGSQVNDEQRQPVRPIDPNHPLLPQNWVARPDQAAPPEPVPDQVAPRAPATVPLVAEPEPEPEPAAARGNGARRPGETLLGELLRRRERAVEDGEDGA